LLIDTIKLSAQFNSRLQNSISNSTYSNLYFFPSYGDLKVLSLSFKMHYNSWQLC